MFDLFVLKIQGKTAAAGYGGQYLLVAPDLDMVVLCTSDWRQPEYPEHHALVNSFVIPAVIRQPSLR
jgi:hypothetical protein